MAEYVVFEGARPRQPELVLRVTDESGTSYFVATAESSKKGEPVALEDAVNDAFTRAGLPLTVTGTGV
jgi:hypothetical protein